VQGTTAGGRVGPDLTHVASRHTLAAGTIPNVRGHLAGWILDPQKIKPGTKMPAVDLSTDELHAVVAYLRSLR
jgi:cytochrome c oxidase subunit 2